MIIVGAKTVDIVTRLSVTDINGIVNTTKLMRILISYKNVVIIGTDK